MKHPFRDSLGRRGMAIFFAACLLVILYLALLRFDVVILIFRHIFFYLAPVIYGIIIAYILDPLIKLVERYLFRRMKRRKVARGLSILLTVVVILCLIGLLVAALVPRMISSAQQLMTNLESYFEVFRQQLIRWEARFPAFNEMGLSLALGTWDGLLDRLTDLLLPRTGTNMDALVETSVNIGKQFINGFIIFFITLYLLADKRRILKGLRRTFQAWLSPEHYRSFRVVALHCHHILVRFIAYNLLDALIVGIVTALFCVIAQIPYPLLITLIVAVTNLIPTFGAIVGALISAALIFLVNPIAVIYFMIFIIALQICDGYILKPHLFGDSTGLAPVWVLVAVVIGTRMFGLIGGLIAVPIAAILSYLFGLHVQKALKRKGIETDGSPWSYSLHRKKKHKNDDTADK